MNISPLTLITRAQPQATSLAKRIREQGGQAILDPLLTFHSLPEGMQWLTTRCEQEPILSAIISSRQALHCLAHATPRRDIPLLTTGPATEEAARTHGFTHIISGDHEGRAGAAYLQPHLSTLPNAPILYPGARHLSPAGEALLHTAPQLERIACYETRLSDHFSADTLTHWPNIHTVTLLSGRTASHFVTLAQQAGLSLSHLHAVTFGVAIADEIRTAGFASLHWPEAQTIEALLRCLKNYSPS